MNSEVKQASDAASECFTPAEVEALKAIEKASADIAAATAKLQAAERDLKEAETELKIVREMKHRFDVFIIYNGVEKLGTVACPESIKVILDAAIRIFGAQNPHTLGLFTTGPNARELDINKTVGAEGIRPRDKLLLRPSTVRGG